MDTSNFTNMDNYLSSLNGKIIHQIWFDVGILPRYSSKKLFNSLKKYRNSWIDNNPSWGYICWNAENCRLLVKTYFHEHLEMYDSYKFQIQRCNCIRYFILYRYGGLYASTDYFCAKSWDDVLIEYPGDIYLVQRPNKFGESLCVSNSLMYSKRGHAFWKKMFIEMERSRNAPVYYGMYFNVVSTTGSYIINKVFDMYRFGNKIGYYPYKLFHPVGVMEEINLKMYAYHLKQCSWETIDGKMITFVYSEFKILLFVLIFYIARFLI